VLVEDSKVPVVGSILALVLGSTLALEGSMLVGMDCDHSNSLLT